ncbi:hypothetical protein Z517_10046 [Fonsecaea pedrosoi CBS 271.37]|uniref:Uncharacterized protein n=1 Tax=Fonsecaea pedrosoi CBS 271.37 TaxID=1442368 RepID=A0A0D2GGA0_9EURO|nr:uncharacterized protein Z517_10046 [Fonsecaea pedrosoi CBS 271.37]KIW77600.1 hypothetical protein Z517_10046 [Fonsecaea pedrosoi CBS 271.37]
MATGPIVLVTGAAGGIGFEIVRTLLTELDGRVVASDIAKGNLERLCSAHVDRLEVVVGDITQEKTSIEAVSRAVDRFGGLTGVCLNAGVFGPCHRLHNSDPDKWTKAIQVNLMSHLYTLKHALPHLRQTHGKVIFTTSAAGQQALFAGWGFYGVSKAAVAFEAKQLHLEEPSLTVLGLSPGLCDTKMVQDLMNGAHEGWSQEDAANYRKAFAGYELSKPEVVGRAYAYAVTKASREVSGSVLEYTAPEIQGLIAST